MYGMGFCFRVDLLGSTYWYLLQAARLPFEMHELHSASSTQRYIVKSCVLERRRYLKIKIQLADADVRFEPPCFRR